jgi:hypothetical protein
MCVRVVRCSVLVASISVRAVGSFTKGGVPMDRYQRWGNLAEQRQEAERYQKRPQHARVPLRVLRCADCLRELPGMHPAHLGDRCGWCWNALLVAEEGEVYA